MKKSFSRQIIEALLLVIGSIIVAILLNMAYKSKYPLSSDESYQGWQINKMMFGVKKEMNNQFFWKVLPFALLVVFVIMAILLLIQQGAGGG